MEDEKLGKRANGIGGGGSGDGGSGSSSARRGLRETERLVEKLRDHFAAFLDALYFTRGATGVRGSAARRELADRLEFSLGLGPDVIGLLRAEAVDMEREERERLEREAAEKAESETKDKETGTK